MGKYFQYFFIIIFIGIFSFFFGSEYKEFYQQNKEGNQSKTELKNTLKKISIQSIKPINDIEIYSTPNEEVRDKIINKINTAQKKIYLETYILTEKRIKESLKKAKKRGLDIKVILEHNPYKAPRMNHKSYTFLQEAGIEVIWSNTKQYTLNHTKIILIDDESIISTGNFSHSTFTKNRDFFVFLKDKKITTLLSQIFLNDFYHKNKIFYHDNLILSPYYSREKLTVLLQSAKKNIQMYFPYIQDTMLKNMIIKQAKLGINIQIITDKKFRNSSSEAMNELIKAGVQIRELPKYNMHSKAILIDNTYLLIGSINLSAYSIDKNKEVGIITKNKNIIEKFTNTYAKDWK